MGRWAARWRNWCFRSASVRTSRSRCPPLATTLTSSELASYFTRVGGGCAARVFCRCWWAELLSPTKPLAHFLELHCSQSRIGLLILTLPLFLSGRDFTRASRALQVTVAVVQYAHVGLCCCGNKQMLDVYSRAS